MNTLEQTINPPVITRKFLEEDGWPDVLDREIEDMKRVKKMLKEAYPRYYPEKNAPSRER